PCRTSSPTEGRQIHPQTRRHRDRWKNRRRRTGLLHLQSKPQSHPPRPQTKTVKPRTLLRLIAILFIAAGFFITGTATSDPAPRNTWRTHHGRLVTVDIVETQKAGRRATL